MITRSITRFFHSHALRIQLMRKTMGVLTIAAMVMSSVPAALLPTVAEAVGPTTLFSDGFESGNFSAWTSADSKWGIDAGSSYEGTKKAKVLGPTSSDNLVKDISTTGYATLTLNYAYRIDNALESGDTVDVQWWDGASWNTLYTITGGVDASWVTRNDALPVGANNLASFKIRFHAALDSGNDKVWLDDVLLTADVAIPTCSGTDTVALTTFDTFSNGSVDTQNSWSSTGSYDQEVVPNVYGFTDFGCKSLRISNAVTTGAFGDQTFAAPTAVGAGESSVATNDHFEAQFDIASTMLSQQPGLFISVSPDDGLGSRMSYLGFSDEADGIHVIFYDVTNTGPLPSSTSWNDTEVAILDRSETHTAKFVMDFVDGPGNDVVKIYINGSLVHTGTSWEDYYRYDNEQTGNGNQLFPVSTLIFRAGGTAAPATNGNGYLFDNISLSSSKNIYQPSGMIITPTSGETVVGSYDFTATYDDGDTDNDDAVQWAVRQGTCAAGTNTVFGNVDGHNDSYSWDGADFSATLDTSSLTPGEYCFIFNPTDDPGQNDVRETQTFFVEAPITEVRVAIMKYVDGELATAGTFPMHASWSADNIGSGSGNYSLTGTGYATTTPYTAVTTAMDPGANYATYEVPNGTTVVGIGDECPIDGYRLVGYRWGETLDEALAADESYDAPSFTNLQSDMYVIVDNETCACDAEASQTIYSDAATQVNGGDAYEITPHPAWTASIPGATWIWSEDINAASESASVGTQVFTRSFTIDGTPLGATLQIATDNTYSVSVNGTWVADSTASLNHFATAETVVIPASVLLPGANEIEISVNNPQWSGTNPAGLLYALTVGTNQCEIPQVKVHILKYLYDGESTTMADAQATDGASFPMHASWSAGNIGSGSGSYTLNPSGYATSTSYAADTTAMDYLADYATYEKTYPNEPTSSVLPIGATCAAGWYRLEGYKVGNTLAEAEAANLSTTAPSLTNLQQDAYVIVVNRDCSTVPTATVTMCKFDTSENPLSGWTLMLKGIGIEDVNVPANTWLSTNSSNPLIAGVSYIATALGEWLNNRTPLNTVDAEYSTEDGWTTHMDGFTGYGSNILDLQINDGFVDWGSYNSGHIYAVSFVPTVSGTTSFRIFDGTGSTPIAGWYGDNTGSLDVNVSEGYAGVTGENGCVTFENVPYGTYSTGEVPQIGWSSISGNNVTVVVDQPEETFTLVNHDDSIIDDTQAHLTIVKHTTGEQDGTFEFTYMDSGENATSTELTTIEGAATSTVFDLEPGSYDITETSQDGWDLAGVSCVSTDDAQYDDITGGVTANIVAGEYLTCTFTNNPGSTTSSETIVVHHGDLASSFGDLGSDSTKWFFYNDETDSIDTSLGSFITGPGVPPLGDGSAQISVSGTQRRNLATYRFAGTPFANITAMQFSTYNPSAGNGGSADRAAYLNFNVDFDGSDTWQKRIAFVPRQNGSVAQDSWQSWDAINGGSAMYSYSGSTWPGTATPGTTLRSWSDIMSSYPGVRIRVSDGWLGMRVGEPYSDGYTENLDRFLMTVDDGSNATTTIFDFEPDVSTMTTITGVSPEPSTVGESYTVSWSVAPTTGSATPTGTVAITVNGGAGCSDDVSVGQCSLTGSSAGTVTLQAFFTGDPGYDDSSSDTTTHEIVEATNGGSSSGDGGSNGPVSFGASFGGGGSVLGAATSTVPTGNFGPSCSQYVTKFMGYGRANDSEQVKRLQYVLGTLEGFDVQQTGVFDLATLAAVRAFQIRYASEILTPWGITNPTGYVYLTTRKKVNEIFCGNGAFPLTSGEQAIIDRTRQGGTGGTGGSSGAAAGSTTGGTQTGSQQGGGSTSDSGTQGAPTTQTGAAAAGEQQGGNIFGKFFKWLFGR